MYPTAMTTTRTIYKNLVDCFFSGNFILHLDRVSKRNLYYNKHYKR